MYQDPGQIGDKFRLPRTGNIEGGVLCLYEYGGENGPAEGHLSCGCFCILKVTI